MNRIRALLSAIVFLILLHPVPAAAVRYIVLQFPAPDLQVTAYSYSRFIPSGLPIVQTFYADANGQVSIDMEYGGYTWYDQIHLDFPAYMNGVAWIDKRLAPPVDFFPVNGPAQRPASYVVPTDPDDLHNLMVFRDVRDWYQANYGYSRGTMHIQYSDRIEYESANDLIDWPADPAYWTYYNPQGWDRFVAAHEYMHGVDQAISGHDPYCTTSTGGVLGFVGAAGCVPHTLCTEGQSYEGSWSEGIADATGFMFANSKGYSFTANPCSDAVASSTTGFYEGNCAALIFNMSQSDPHQWFNTYRYARIANAQGQTRPAQTAEEFYSLWCDTDPSPNLPIATHHPGTFNATAIYQWAIQGTRSISGVANDSLITEGERIRWIRQIDPNPANGNFDVHVRVPSSGDVSLSLFTVTGKRVMQRRFTGLPVAETNLHMNVDGLPSGMYVVLYEDAGRHRIRDTTKLAIVK